MHSKYYYVFRSVLCVCVMLYVVCCMLYVVCCVYYVFSSPNKNCIHLNTVMLNFNPLAMNHVLSRHKTHVINDKNMFSHQVKVACF